MIIAIASQKCGVGKTSTPISLAADLARTYNTLVDLLYRKFFEQIKGGKKLRVAVLHGSVLEQAQALAERIREEYHPLELLVNMTGPVLGINTGPGALVLCGYAED